MSRSVSLDALVDEVCGVMSDMVVLVHTRTGEVASLSWDWELEPEERERFEDDAWCEVPCPDEDSDGRIMWAFACEQRDLRVRAALQDALSGPRPFHAFREALRRFALQDAWHPHYEAEMRRYLRTWLEVEGLAFSEGDPAAP